MTDVNLLVGLENVFNVWYNFQMMIILYLKQFCCFLELHSKVKKEFLTELHNQ